MKKLIPFLLLLALSYSCSHEETISPALGNAIFSLSPQARGNGRVSETATPAFVLLSIKDNKGGVQENIKLPLYALGQSYLSENLDLQTGTYQLTQFTVLDATNKIIYATPLEGSDLAKYVADPLPIDFTIEEDKNTQVVPQVLAVSIEDTPESFGLASFGFDIVSQNGKVKKVVYTDLFVKDSPAVSTMYFQYQSGRVQTIHWDFDFSSFGVTHHPYLEERFYLADGSLDSISGGRFNGGALNLSYQYKDGLRYKIVSKRNGNSTTVTFMNYDGTKPEQIENLYGIYGVYEGMVYPHHTALEFDASGNLISQKNTDIPGYGERVEEKTTVYGTELNPLRNLIETPLPQVFEFYDDLAFYFSVHLPSSVEANNPYVDPRHNRTFFEYEKDDQGRVTQVRALKPDTTPPPRPVPDLRYTTRYTLDITYY